MWRNAWPDWNDRAKREPGAAGVRASGGDTTAGAVFRRGPQARMCSQRRKEATVSQQWHPRPASRSGRIAEFAKAP
jgi:hypothetical protein